MEIIFVDQICYSLALPKVSGREMRSKVKIKKGLLMMKNQKKHLHLAEAGLKKYIKHKPRLSGQATQHSR